MTAKPVTQPAMAPKALRRFHQIERMRMGNAADAVKAKAQLHQAQGSVGRQYGNEGRRSLRQAEREPRRAQPCRWARRAFSSVR